MKRQVTQLDFSGIKIHVGIDTHLKSWKVGIALDHSIQKVFSQEPRPEILANYLARHYPNGDYLCVYEAGFCGFWIQEELTRLGINCKVVNAADVPTTDKEKRQKTDRRDCRKLARCLRNEELEFIDLPSKQLQKDRSVLRTRYKIKKDLNRAKQRIVSHLYFYGIKEPEQVRRYWTKDYISWLDQVVDQSEDIALGMLVEEFKQLRQLDLEALNQISKLSKTERYAAWVKLLLSVPGIGLLTSMCLLVEIGDIRRFKKLDHLCSMVGLVPNTNSSGENEQVGQMTRRGRKELRTPLIESAWVAIRHDPELALCFEQYRKRMKATEAIIRIAKKLLNRIRYVLLNEQPYKIATV